MASLRWILGSLIAWFGVWTLWLSLTWKFHPTVGLALIVTTSLIAAYANVVSLDLLVLRPVLLLNGKRLHYVASLAYVMAFLTALALFVIRIAYIMIWGRDPDPNGLYKHFAIDLFGMVVHLVLASAVMYFAGNSDRSNAKGTKN